MKEDYYDDYDYEVINHQKEHYNRKKEKEKVKNKRRQQKEISFIENELESFRIYSRDDDIFEVNKLIALGEEIKTKDIELVKNIIKTNKIKKKIGTYSFGDYILEILSFNDKKIFCIRSNNEYQLN